MVSFFFSFLFSLRLYFLIAVWLHSINEGRYRDFPIYSCLHTSTTHPFTPLSISPTRGGDLLQGYICCSWWTCIDTIQSSHYGSLLVPYILWAWTHVWWHESIILCHTEYFHFPKNPCALPVPPVPGSKPLATHWPFYHLCSFACSQMS